MNSHDPHIHTLLERWISGDITAPEEATLRDAARQDAFLRDALNGYTRHAGADHVRALDNLRRRTAATPTRNWRPWLGVAAALLSLVVAAWWITLSQDGSAESLAATKPPAEAAYPPKEDLPAVNAPLADAAPQREHQPAAVAPALRTAPDASAAAPPTPRGKSAYDSSDNPFAAKATNETEELPGSAAQSPYPTPASVPAPPTAAPSTLPADADQARARADYASSESRKQTASPSWAASALQSDSAVQNAYPINGLNEFNNYVALNSPPRSKGEWVTLRFDLDAAGYPIRIEVLDASRKTLHAKAIELLRDGGPWQLVPGAPTQGVVYRMVF